MEAFYRSPTLSGPPWWRRSDMLLRFVSDFLHAELQLMRRGGAGLPAQPWPPTLDLEAQLGVDSLERFALASALGVCLELGQDDGGPDLLTARTLGDWCERLTAWLDRTGLAAMQFKTSGSSGVPKRCRHAFPLLWEEACFFANQLQQTQRLCYAVPAHHIYGFLFSVLLPLALGPREVVLRDVRRELPGTLLASSAPGDVLIGYPEWWAACADLGQPWPPGVTAISSTAPCPPAVAQGLSQSGLRLLEIYGSSETAGVGWRSDWRAPYTLLPYWERGWETRTLLRPQVAGTLLEAHCQDQIDWQDARHFRPGARQDQAVQVGGVNVYPEQVAALLRRHPQVADAVVRLMRPDEGTRLKAFIVPADGSDAATLDADLRGWIRERLPGPARPVSYTFGAAPPRTAQGKAGDWITAAPAPAPTK